MWPAIAIIAVFLMKMTCMCYCKPSNHIVIVTMPFSFIVIKNENKNTNVTTYGGLAFDIINHITNKYNLTYEVNMLEKRIFGVKLENDSWNGMVGKVARGEADVAANEFTISHARAEVVDFSPAFTRDEITLMLRRPVVKPMGIFQPLEQIVWYSCLGCILIVGLVMYLLLSLSNVLGVSIHKQTTILDCLLYTASIQLVQGITMRYKFD